ncbi:uncharacterized protein LOC127007150 isoform X2 [Eriocheir sinensis]|uniref:uncharacterized protein LOC127007150 isoform X2 n=1 Tax=Eriocheir sinensis TaxID=95602 RepID=UPI0021CA6818|nr:uncharacterized protein LOC127007150 isoform X2 [Eriocheir sinensis]
MKGLVALFFVALLGTGSPQVLEGCFDPPGDGPLADIIVDGLEAARPIMSEGVPELGIPPLDPFGPIPLIEFHIDVPQLRMDGYVDQTLVKNLAQYIICSVNVSLGITQKFAFEFRLDNFRMEGKYAVDGLIASLFPVFGDGDFSLDTYTTGFSGGAKISYNVLTDHASIKDLTFDIFFQSLNLELECILGCGDMADLINSVTDDIAPAIFDAVWGVLQPALAHALETAINEILKDINISDIISPPSEAPNTRDLGNANEFVDLVMNLMSDAVVAAGLDPAPLPDASLDLGLGIADLYEGQLGGLSTMYRSGTCTLDKVASWVFLYANLAVDNLQIYYRANVTSGSTSLATIGGTVEVISVYMVARQDIYGLITDIDQFVITDFGRINLDIDGLGVLGFLLEPLTEAVANLLRDDISNLLENEIKNLLQDILGETPWPAF